MTSDFDDDSKRISNCADKKFSDCIRVKSFAGQLQEHVRSADALHAYEAGKIRLSMCPN
jgi:hypothetical protein